MLGSDSRLWVEDGCGRCLNCDGDGELWLRLRFGEANKKDGWEEDCIDTDYWALFGGELTSLTESATAKPGHKFTHLITCTLLAPLQLITFAGPIFGVMCAKLISFSLLSLKAAKFGLVSLASHNILLKILFFFTTFGDSLSQVGQTYLPGVLAKSRSENDAKANKEEMNLFSFMKTSAALAIAFGGFCGLSGFTATKMGWLFTPNVDVVSKMATISRPMLLSLFLHPGEV